MRTKKSKLEIFASVEKEHLTHSFLIVWGKKIVMWQLHIWEFLTPKLKKDGKRHLQIVAVFYTLTYQLLNLLQNLTPRHSLEALVAVVLGVAKGCTKKADS